MTEFLDLLDAFGVAKTRTRIDFRPRCVYRDEANHYMLADGIRGPKGTALLAVFGAVAVPKEAREKFTRGGKKP